VLYNVRSEPHADNPTLEMWPIGRDADAYRLVDQHISAV
jgi:hypothetical protein